MDLIRELLLKLEKLNMPPLGTAMISPWGDELAVEGRIGDEILYHLQQIVDAGLVEVQGSGFSAGGDLMFRRLNFRGHDFLDTVRDPEAWRRVKAGANQVKDWSFDTLKDIARGLVSKKIKDLSGIDVDV
jgi:hypothetical protein